jgi:hypothetical protein
MIKAFGWKRKTTRKHITSVIRGLPVSTDPPASQSKKSQKKAKLSFITEAMLLK